MLLKKHWKMLKNFCLKVILQKLIKMFYLGLLVLNLTKKRQKVKISKLKLKRKKQIQHREPIEKKVNRKRKLEKYRLIAVKCKNHSKNLLQKTWQEIEVNKGFRRLSPLMRMILHKDKKCILVIIPKTMMMLFYIW